ncbi:alpha/beta fold hydrolase [Winogradskya consettensis]|uniref:Alpha/beta hydrolase n=1 Tax=Winogradskya consettensis TaxID=113560 RepID=A0A919VTX3_9ACTN|nr:alpha/beta fold hydrolase [Actinoplanes consettensis]GIM76451.1 alpha/beta hydrolase [Actinoplanes consettensis]
MSTPVVFIHGLWIHSAAWQPWQDLFAEAGYETHAPGWTGDSATPAATRSRPEAIAGLGVAELTEGYARYLAKLPVRPIVVGHSFGGLIAQKLLATGAAEAAVAISPAPIKGATKLPLAQIRSALPVLSNPRNKTRAVALSERQFRYGFGNAISKEESRRLFDAYAIPGPGRPIFELTAAKKDPSSPTEVDVTAARGPLLITGAADDHTVPEVVSRQAYGLYANSPSVTEYHAFAGRGHSLVFDSGWRDVAQYALGWIASLSQKELSDR